MDNFYSVGDIGQINSGVQEALSLKSAPYSNIGTGKTLVMLFFNSSLRTRLSTEIAAKKLGMDVITMDMSKSWPWEVGESAVMNQNTAEHIKDAAKVISGYADIIAIRSFPGLKDQQADYRDQLHKAFMKYSSVPVINLESSILHPLQSLADMMTIEEYKKKEVPRIVLSWAPHIKPLPQAVANSFLEWCHAAGHRVTITHPAGMELSPDFTKGHHVENDQEKALNGADFVYVKNWSSFSNYGQISRSQGDWMIDENKMALTDDGRFMHCMPVRRNVVVSDQVLDGPRNLMYEQAENRLHAARFVMQKILKNG